MSPTVDAREFAVDLANPLDTADGRIDRRRGWLVRIEAGDAVGVGEATPLPGWTESREACADALERATGALRDGDAFPDAGSLPDPADWIDGSDGESEHRILPDPADAPAARHGLAGALADVHARRAGRSLARYLGGPGGVESVPVNATVGDGDVAATERAAEEATAAGFDCLKVKVGARDLDADLERLEAVREAVGEGVAVRADANGAWDRPTAGEAFDRLGGDVPPGIDDELATGIDPEYVEQPLPADDLAGHALFRRQSSVNVAVDETLVEAGAGAVLATGAADVVVCKPMALGGPDRVLSVARQAAGEGIRTVVTTTIDAAPARTAAVHVAAALPDPPACGLATADRLASDLGTDPAPVEDGRIRVPDGPGVARREVVEGWWDR